MAKPRKKESGKARSHGFEAASQKSDPHSTFVAYDHTTGQPYLIDKSTGRIALIDLNLPEGKEALKGENGRYRTEIKNECKRLFMAGVKGKEIEERTGVPVKALANWAYNSSGNRDYKKCWMYDREQALKEAKQHNVEIYALIEKNAMDRVTDFLNEKGSKITNTREFVAFTQAIQNLSRSINGNLQANVKEKPANATQVNVYNQVTPLTPEESRSILENDPIRRIAEATTKGQASQVLEDIEAELVIEDDID